MPRPCDKHAKLTCLTSADGDYAGGARDPAQAHHLSDRGAGGHPEAPAREGGRLLRGEGAKKRGERAGAGVRARASGRPDSRRSA